MCGGVYTCIRVYTEYVNPSSDVGVLSRTCRQTRRRLGLEQRRLSSVERRAVVSEGASFLIISPPVRSGQQGADASHGGTGGLRRRNIEVNWS